MLTAEFDSMDFGGKICFKKRNDFPPLIFVFLPIEIGKIKKSLQFVGRYGIIISADFSNKKEITMAPWSSG